MGCDSILNGKLNNREFFSTKIGEESYSIKFMANGTFFAKKSEWDCEQYNCHGSLKTKDSMVFLLFSECEQLKCATVKPIANNLWKNKNLEFAFKVNWVDAENVSINVVGSKMEYTFRCLSSSGK